MDKNMIHIDELFRQRLTGAEESERAGAWMRMRELLDEQMPQGTPVSGNHTRKIFSYMAGVLMLGAIGFGGYKWMSSQQSAEGNVSGNTIDAAANEQTAGQLIANTQLANMLPQGATLVLKNGKAVVLYDPSATSRDVILNSITRYSRSLVAEINNIGLQRHTAYKDIEGRVIASNIAAYELEAKPSVNDNVAVTGDGRMNINTTVANTANHNTGNNTKAANKQQPAAQRANSNRQGKTATHKVADTKAAKSGLAHSSAGAMTIKKVRPLSLQQGGNITGDMRHRNISNMDGNELSAAIPPAGGKAEVQKGIQYDSLQEYMGKVEIREYWATDPVTKERYFKVDTIGTSTIPIDRYVPKEMQPKRQQFVRREDGESSGRIAKNVPARKTKSTRRTAKNSQDITPNATFRGKASRTSNIQRFSDAITEVKNNMKYDIANAQFSPSIIAGVNSVFGPSTWGGFQFGIVGNVQFNDKLTVASELKYLHRFNGGTILNDNYTTLVTPTPGTWREDKVQHFFRYSALQSVELPVSVRYAAGNFNIFVGGSFVYNFAINAQESNNVDPGVLQTGEIPVSATADQPRYSIRDFNARYGFGYLFGTAYRLNPALQLDLRLTQTLWDNSNTPGALWISNNVYRKPSLQLSIGYRFDQHRGSRY